MAKNAAELVDAIVEKRARTEQRAYEGLKQKIVDATALMIADLSFDTEVDLTEEDLMALTLVTDGLRELGYKHCLIETQNSSGEILGHRLRISVQHLV